MPITKSAKKALRQNIKRRKKNIHQKKALKATIKSYRLLISENNLEKASEQLPLVYKKLDKASRVNLIKKNKANRLKSRLAQKLKALPTKS